VKENSEKRLVPPFEYRCTVYILAETVSVQFSFEGTKSVTMPDGLKEE
jgi:hypothetical protein